MSIGLIGSEIIAQRVFGTVYIYLDIVFLVGLCVLLAVKKKFLTLIFGLFGGILYFVVDYGIFHLALGTRTIEGGDMFWVLLWMSMSYGLTNFVWIWLWFARDKDKFLFTALILVWWLCAPMLAQLINSQDVIKIQRTTGAYHGTMALILLVGYAAAIIYNMFRKDRAEKFPLLWLFATGVAVQLGWEFMLLIGGIRSAEFTGFEDKLMTLVVNSLLETNLGAVPLYCIYVFITSRVAEDMRLRPTRTTFIGRLRELNEIPLFKVKKEEINFSA